MLANVSVSPSNLGIACIPRVVMNCALPSDKLNLCHINIQSLCARQMTKFNELKLCVVDSKIDILCLTETWLTDNINDNVIAIDGYKLIRNDRKYSRGGGICVYFRNDIVCSVVSQSELTVAMDDSNTTEYLFLEVVYKQNKFLLGTFYNPPRRGCSEMLFEKLSTLALFYRNTVVVGDFNTDLIKNDTRSNNLKNAIESSGFECINSEPTHFCSGASSLIDLMITNNPDFLYNFNQVSGPGFSKHDIIFASINISKSGQENEVRTYRDYFNVDNISLSAAVSSIDWNMLYSMTDPDMAVNFFNNRLLELYESFIPLRICKPKKNPWFNNDILRSMIERDVAYSLWKRTKDSVDHFQYKRLRNRVTHLINLAKSNYMSRNMTASTSNRDLWTRLKQLDVVNNTDKTVQFSNTPDEINEYFGSNFTSNDAHLPLMPPAESGFNFSYVNQNDVILAISSINSNAIGLDGLPIRFIKHILPLIISEVCFIFNLIISAAKYPAAWKSAKIIPIKKSARGTNLNNLRPISILSALSKAFGKILKNQIQSFLNSNNLLSNFQSGFRSGHSTTTAILKVHDDIHEVIDKKGVAFLLFIDFSKAFDRVSHVKLLNKLYSQFFFSRASVKLLQTYLTGRNQVVSVNGTYSQSISILSGIPQGSVLGPLLFTMFINDLPTILKSCKIHMFADDVQLYLSASNLDVPTMARLINKDLERLYQWTLLNFLPINANKTKAMFISRSRIDYALPQLILGQDVIEYVQSASVLGFIIQNDLEWDKHVSAQCTKIYNGLRQLRLTANMLNSETKIQLFKSLLLPHFMYGAVLLLNASARALDRLRVALNSCVRYVFNLSRYSRVTHLQPKLIGCPFYQFFKLRACLILHKLISSSSPTYLHQKLVPFRSSRVRNYVLPQYSTSHYGNTLFVRGIALWNQLPNNIKNNLAPNVFRQDSIEWFNRRN